MHEWQSKELESKENNTDWNMHSFQRINCLQIYVFCKPIDVSIKHKAKMLGTLIFVKKKKSTDIFVKF